jgi:integrase
MRIGKQQRDYWRKKLEKRTYKTAQGDMAECTEYCVRLQYNGERHRFNTHQTNKEQAIDVVIRFYAKLQSCGSWNEAVENIFPRKERKSGITAGDFIEAILQYSTKKEGTLQIYFKKFRTLVSEIFGIGKDRLASYANGAAYKAWLTKVNAVKLADLSSDKIQAWKKKRLLACGNDPKKEACTRNTINTILRNAKALFAPSIRSILPLELPTTTPFDGIEFERTDIVPYSSKIHALKTFLDTAYSELWENYTPIDVAMGIVRVKSEAYKVILLSLLAGLRRGEMDTLTWDQVDFVANVIRIRTTAHTATKTFGSERDIHMNEFLVKQLGMMRSQNTAVEFVINNDVMPNIKLTTQHHYRCRRIFLFASNWLRRNGINDHKPIHALRKEYGSEIYKLFGSFAAQNQLGHKSVATTSKYYFSPKERYEIKVLP